MLFSESVDVSVGCQGLKGQQNSAKMVTFLQIAAFVVNDTVMGGRSDSELLTSQARM